MKPTLKHALGALAVAGGFLFWGGQPAMADDGVASEAGSTVQVGNVSPSAQVSACGNSVSLGDAQADGNCGSGQSSSSGGGARVEDTARPRAGERVTSEAGSTVQAGNVSPSAQVSACGNSVSLGEAGSSAACSGRTTTTSAARAAQRDADATAGDEEPVAGEPPGQAPPHVNGRQRERPHGQVLGLTLDRTAPSAVLRQREGTITEPFITRANRSSRVALPLTGETIPWWLGWGALFLASGVGLLISDALTS